MDVQPARRKLTQEVQIQEMIAEGGPLPTPDVPERLRSQQRSGHPATRASGPIGRSLDSIAQRIAARLLDLLAENEVHVGAAVGGVERRATKAARKTALLLEFVDDFRDGHYQTTSWRSLALASLAIAFVADPDDVVPRGFSFLRGLDDVAVAALVTRALEDDLREYCLFKGYDAEEYF